MIFIGDSYIVTNDLQSRSMFFSSHGQLFAVGVHFVISSLQLDGFLTCVFHELRRTHYLFAFCQTIK